MHLLTIFTGLQRFLLRHVVLAEGHVLEIHILFGRLSHLALQLRGRGTKSCELLPSRCLSAVTVIAIAIELDSTVDDRPGTCRLLAKLTSGTLRGDELPSI